MGGRERELEERWEGKLWLISKINKIYDEKNGVLKDDHSIFCGLSCE